MLRAGFPWAVAAAAVLWMGCSGSDEDEDFGPEPGDANAGALALAVEGKVFAAEALPADTVTEGGGTRPTPEPTPTPSVPDQVTLAIFSNCQTGEACLTYGVYEPETERKVFVTATCALDESVDGFVGTCYTYDDFEWSEFCEVRIETGSTDTIVTIRLVGQNKVFFYEAPYSVSGNSDCASLENPPSPRPTRDD